MKRLLTILSVIALLAAGCGKDNDSKSSSGAKPASTATETTQSQPGGVETTTGSTDTGTDTGSDVEDQGY